MLLDAGYMTVIAPMSVSKKVEALNVNANRAATMIASALESENLLAVVTAEPG